MGYDAQFLMHSTIRNRDITFISTLSSMNESISGAVAGYDNFKGMQWDSRMMYNLQTD